jgi:molybdopterin synthase sulfur carrier subunit
MVKVEFLGPIKKDTIEIDARNIKEVAVLLKRDFELREWIDVCAIAVNDRLVNSDVWLSDGDKVSLLPPVCGG